MVITRFVSAAFLAPWLTLTAVAIAIIVDLTAPGQIWPGDLLLSSEWLSTSFFLVSGLVAGAASLDGYLRFNVDRGPWLRRPAARLTTALRWLVAEALAICVPTAVAAAMMASTVDFHQTQPTVLRAAVSQLLLSSLSLAALALVGMALGSAFGRWGVVFSVAFGYAIGMRAMDDHWMPITFGGVNGSMVGMSIPTTLQLAQAFALLGFIAVGLAVTAGRPGGRTNTVKGTAALLALTLAVVMSFGSSHRRYMTFSPAAQNETGPCVVNDEGRPTTCSTSEHRRLLETAARLHDETVNTGNRLGISLPELALERTIEQVARTDVSYWYASPQALAGVANLDRNQFLDDVSTPAWCPGLRGDKPPTDAFFANAATLARILHANRDPGTTPSEKDRSEAQRLWRSLSRCEGAS